MRIAVRKLREDAVLPARGSAEAAGADLRACMDEERIELAPGETKLIGTGLSMAVPTGYFGGIFARSGLSVKEGLRPSNCVGVIDSDYRGEVKVALYNDSSQSRVIERGERIAQLLILPYLAPEFEEAEAEMNRINYQKQLDALLKHIEADNEAGRKPPRLFLHSCCAPCSSYVLEYLSDYFQITDFFYNPNIEPREEYRFREEELMRLISEMKPRYPIDFLPGWYDPSIFHRAVKGLESLPEGGERCFICYRLRMEEAAKLAAAGGYDYFTTTLSISPLKNAEKINEIGQELEKEYGVRHLPSDFKKKNGYLRSVQLSQEHQLYRQDFCGCVYSKAQREREKRQAGV